MDKKKIENASLDGTDSYLRTQRIRAWIVAAAVLVLAAGALTWLFFGSCNITVTGYAYVSGNVETYCFVSSRDIDRVTPGMTVWVNNTKGKIMRVADHYYTYDQLLFLYGNSIANLHVKEDEVYYSVSADIRQDRSDFGKFTIITDTVTPFACYFGGMDK